MSGRRARRAPPDYTPGQLLDWTSSAHWDYEGPQPCRYCGKPTQLRDSWRKPAHKTCAETALATQAKETAEAYRQKGTL
ncbi:MAG: hypothetical protein HOV92_00625 [Streptomyces sp.]|nr:hypothetical protein [Streptomyces sp.]